MEFRLVELQTSAVGAIRGFQSMTVSMKRRSRSGSVNSLEDSTSLAPKEEGRLLLSYSCNSFQFLIYVILCN